MLLKFDPSLFDLINRENFDIGKYRDFFQRALEGHLNGEEGDSKFMHIADYPSENWEESYRHREHNKVINSMKKGFPLGQYAELFSYWLNDTIPGWVIKIHTYVTYSVTTAYIYFDYTAMDALEIKRKEVMKT